MSRNWTAARSMTCVAALSAAIVTLTACGSDNGASNNSSQSVKAGCATGSLSGGGSTFQPNIEQQWTADFAQRCSGAQVNYSGIGSGAGIQQFGTGTIDFAGSDVPMLPDEKQAADNRCGGTAITFPVTAGGIAVIYHLDGAPKLRLSAATLAGIFQGSIKHWDDAAVKADNPGARLPSTAVVSYHRADGSGTTAVFSAFEKAATTAWTLGSDKELNWTSGQGAMGSDGVVQGVKSTNGGITYAEVSYADANNLPTASVAAGKGDFVTLSSDTVSQAIDSGFTVTGSGNDVSGQVDFAKLQGYPLSTVSYAIACSHYAKGDTAALIKAFLGYVLGDGQSGVDALGYAPLPSSVLGRSKAAIQSVG
ncbi:MAG: phosphate transport system substrate-binding protein [Frankiaceae bacterium]|nr:phosphate transport system substrate-binding protein [Frankiaceae bacterium]